MQRSASVRARCCEASVVEFRRDVIWSHKVVHVLRSDWKGQARKKLIFHKARNVFLRAGLDA